MKSVVNHEIPGRKNQQKKHPAEALWWYKLRADLRNLLRVSFPLHVVSTSDALSVAPDNIMRQILGTVGAGADGGAEAKLWCLHIFTSSAYFSSDSSDLPR